MITSMSAKEARAAGKLAGGEGHAPDRHLLRTSPAYRDAYLFALGCHDGRCGYSPDPRFSGRKRYIQGLEAGRMMLKAVA